MEPTAEKPDDMAYNVGIVLLIAFGIAFNVYVAMDIATDGAFTKRMVNRALLVWQDAKVSYGVHRDKMTVLLHATNIAEKGIT